MSACPWGKQRAAPSESEEGGISSGDWISTHICTEGTMTGVGGRGTDLGAKASQEESLAQPEWATSVVLDH